MRGLDLTRCFLGAAGREVTTHERALRPPLTKRSEEHTSELQSRQYLVCRLLLEKKKTWNAGHDSLGYAPGSQMERLRLGVALRLSVTTIGRSHVLPPVTPLNGMAASAFQTASRL